MSNKKKALLPILVLSVGIAGTVIMVQARPDVEKVASELPPPLVRVLPVEPETVQLTVLSQGAVYPHTESDLVAEVSGRVVWVSPHFEAGGFFEPGEELLRLDPRDYELNLKSAVAQVAQADLALARERAEAEVAREEWAELGGGEASPLVQRVPQAAEAEARLQAAEAARERAELDLERTRIGAPFAGRVWATRVDLGEFVNRGVVLATLYSVDFAEVRLPMPDAELAFLDYPLRYLARGEGPAGPPVELRAEFAGRSHTWEGRIVRYEGEIDPTTRMVHLVARVGDPYGRSSMSSDLERPPLSVGMFVEAEILGARVESVVRLPRSAMQGGDRVLVVDREDRLRFRQVEVLRATAEEVLLEQGLEPGERVVLSALDAAVNGMRVRTTLEPGAGPPPRAEAAAEDRS